MMRLMSGPGSIAGATVAAISGIEIALLDLVGKHLKTPVYQLLGGKFRHRIRVYADSHAPTLSHPDDWRQRALQVRERGFDAIKFDLDPIAPETLLDSYNRTLTTQAIRRMVEVVAAVTEVLGPDVELALDCHWSYNVTDAIRLAQALEPFSLLWLEDPTPPENVEAMAQVRAATSTPICTGENLYTRHGFRPLIEKGGCHIIQPDIPRCGGLLESKRIADLADIYYIPFAAHNVCSPVGTVASAHACAAIRTFLVLEFHSQDVPWWDAVVAREHDPLIKNGYLTLSDQPGLGIELNDEVCRQHVQPGTLYFGEAV
jgi:L-alanine-DL-glutamate epimerase-like enolase superfamily enzyme